MMEAAEFERLPPALRRKYFSNLERLRLAQKSAASRHPNGRQLRKLRPTLERRSTHRGHVHAAARSPTRRLQKSESVKRHYLRSQAEAQWFLSLPKKIQDRHFSREEQVLLAGRRDNIILDAADEVLYRIGHQSNLSHDSLQTMSTSQSKTSLTAKKFGAEELHTDENSGEGHDPFRWLDDEDKLDLSLDDYHQHIARTALPPTLPTSSCKPSFRRALSLSSLSFSRNSISSSKLPPSTPLTSNPPTPTQASHPRPLSSVTPNRQSGSRHVSRSSISTIDPSAKHYRDPEARLKLRVYLASPQKFDEAIEFGFPSMESNDATSHNRPDLKSHRTEGSVQTFLKDDSGSLFEDEGGNMYKDEDDSSTIEDIDSPITPRDGNIRTSRSSHPNQSSESSSGPLRPRQAPRPSASYHPLSLGHHHSPPTVNREMTLHMTLTRPDLRAAEEISALGHRAEDDPLRLADLPRPGTGRTNIWETIPAEEGMVKKMWRKLRHR